MGKTAKGKAKVAVKKAKAAAKIARKCKSAAVCLVGAALTLLIGCAEARSAQPAKSQSQHNEFEDCIIIIAAKATVNPKACTNATVVAEGSTAVPEMFTQTQSLENSGTETLAPNNTQTPTTETKPDITVQYAQGGGISNRSAGGAASASSILGTLTQASLQTLTEWISGKKSGTVQLTKTDGTTTTATCTDGSCTVDGVTITASDCANCTP